MALDAFVRCRCWEEGRTSPPPVPADQIAVDEDGILNPTIPYQGNEELHRAFSLWRRHDACAHEWMEAAWARIGSGGSYALFREALGHAGWHRFPVLKAELPVIFHGMMSAAAAARMLEELRRLTGVVALGERTELRDADTGDVVWTYIAAFDGVVLGLGMEAWLGVDPAGFFIWNPRVDPPVEVFRAIAFTQRYAGGTGRDLRAEFDDGNRRVVLRVGHGLIGGHESTGPARLEVVTRPARVADFANQVEALTTVCRAAVATGNPVIWC
jgi:hypothetical protein